MAVSLRGGGETLGVVETIEQFASAVHVFLLVLRLVIVNI